MILGYLIKDLPQGVPAHVRTTDVDFVVGIAIGGDSDSEPYRTFENNIRAAGFRQCVDDKGLLNRSGGRFVSRASQ